MSERHADDRLEGKIETGGGLVIKKKKTDDGEAKATSESSGRSSLGLDRLASAKRDHARKRLDDGDDTGVTDSVRRGIERVHEKQRDRDDRGMKYKSRDDDRRKDRYRHHDRSDRRD